MPKVVTPTYPNELTEKYWDKNKGLLAKAFKGETGITAELKKAKATFDKVEWKLLDSATYSEQRIKHGERVTPEKADEILKSYLADVHPEFASLEKTFSGLSSFLAGQAKTLSAATTTKAAGKTASTMADAARKFSYAVAWGTLSSRQQAWLADQKKSAVDVQKSWATARAKIAPEITRASKALIDFAAKVKPYFEQKAAAANDPSKQPKSSLKSDYEKLVGEYLRGIGAKIKQAQDPALEAQFKPILDEVKTLWSQGGGPKEDKDVPDHVRKASDVLKRFNQTAKAAGL